MSYNDEIEMILNRPVYYDRDGKPLSYNGWMELMKQVYAEAAEAGGGYPVSGYKRVAEDTLNDPDGKEHYISTVWLGMDHAFQGPPLIFETMVFCHHAGDCGWADFMWDRYPNVREAEEGHRAAVAAVREGRKPSREIYDSDA